jgi:hypothetical protein
LSSDPRAGLADNRTFPFALTDFYEKCGEKISESSPLMRNLQDVISPSPKGYADHPV